MLSTHQFILLYFFKEAITCFICIFYSKFLAYVLSRHIPSNYIFSIKPIVCNISNEFSPLNIFSSTFLQFMQVIERTNVFYKMHDILRFLHFLYLQQITQYNFFMLLVIENFYYCFIILLMNIRRK